MNDKLTSELFFRVHSFVKEKYMSLSAKQKKIVKLALESIILSLAEDKENFSKIAKELGIELVKDNLTLSPINININVNEVKAQAKSEAKVNIDISKLTEILNELESLLIAIQKNNFNAKQNAYTIPPARWKDLTEKIDSLKKLVN
jgi:ABC-type long-subunit fatty acid transport system fused permease/ATPase subunit